MRTLTITILFLIFLILNAQSSDETSGAVATPTKKPGQSKEAKSIVQQLVHGRLRPSSITPDMVESVERELSKVNTELFAESVIEHDAQNASPAIVDDPVPVSLVSVSQEDELIIDAPELVKAQTEPRGKSRSSSRKPVAAETKKRKNLVTMLGEAKVARQAKRGGRRKPFKGLASKLFKPRENPVMARK